MNPFFLLIPLAAIFPVLFSGNKEKYVFGNPSDYKTWDQKTNQNIATLHPSIRDKAALLVNSSYKIGYKVRIFSALRSWKEQKELYKIGRSTGKKGAVVTNAQPGRSYHNYGLAIDIIVYDPIHFKWTYNPPSPVISVAKKIGFSWGGDWTSFKDTPHFQISNKNISTLENLYKKNNKGKDGYVTLSGIFGLGNIQKKKR